jgi:hypothetical protein
MSSRMKMLCLICPSWQLSPCVRLFPFLLHGVVASVNRIVRMEDHIGIYHFPLKSTKDIPSPSQVYSGHTISPSSPLGTVFLFSKVLLKAPR